MRKNDSIIDVEACGGTHLESSSEADSFVITGSNKVQDGVIRLNYKAGEAATQHLSQLENRIEKLSKELGVEQPENERKAQRDLVELFSVEPDHLENTIQKFRDDNQMLQHKIEKLSDYLDQDIETVLVEGDNLVEKAESIFETRKQREKKQLEGLENDIETHVRHGMEDRVVEQKIPTENVGLFFDTGGSKLARNFEAPQLH